MADNSDRTPGSGETIRSEDKAGVKTQVVLLDVGGSSTEALAGDGVNALPVGGYGAGGFWPERAGVRRGPVNNAGRAGVLLDSEGNLLTRGAVTTDEQSVRDDFPGSGLTQTLTGTVTLTNGSTAITGSGTAFLTELEHNSYIKLAADAESAYAQIASVESDTAATLVAAYSGTGGSATGALEVEFRPVTGSGGTISVANSSVTLASGTTTGAQTYLTRMIDYGPMAVTFAGVTMSQRIANNDMILGVQDAPTSPTRFARFRATGTTNTSIIFESAYVHTGTPGGNDTETTTLTLPNAATTATARRYRIELLIDRVRAYIDDVLVADHATHMPDAYDVMALIAGHINATSPATTTSLVIDAIGINNFNKLSMAIASNAESLIAANAPLTFVTGSVTSNNNPLAFVDGSQVRAINFQLISVGGGCTVSFQASNDGTTYVAIPAFPLAGGVSVTTTTTVGQWIIPTQGARFVRCQVTALTSGTITSQAALMQHVPPLPTSNGSTINTVSTITTVTTVSTLTNITNWGNVADNAAFTDGTTRLSMSGYIFDETAGTALTENDAAAARVDSKRAQVFVLEDATTRAQRQSVNTSGGASVTPIPHTAGGSSYFHLISAGSTNATNLKASAGQITGWSITNTTASWRYVKLHNTAGTPTAGSAVVYTIGVPPNGGNNKDFPFGIPFATGIAITTVTGVADNDTAAVSSGDLNINIEYK